MHNQRQSPPGCWRRDTPTPPGGGAPLVDKGRVHRRGIEAVVQLQAAEALERLVEGQGMKHTLRAAMDP